MNSDGRGVSEEKIERVHDQGPSPIFAEFMKTGWLPTEFADL